MGGQLLEIACERGHAFSCALMNALIRSYHTSKESRVRDFFNEFKASTYYFKLAKLSQQKNAQAQLIDGLAHSLLVIDVDGNKPDIDINDWLNRGKDPYIEAAKWHSKLFDYSSVDYRHYTSLIGVYTSELLGLETASRYRIQIENMLIKLKGKAFVQYYKAWAEDSIGR